MYYVIKTFINDSKIDDSSVKAFDNKKDAKEYCELKNKAHIINKRLQSIENNFEYKIDWVYVVAKQI